MSRARDIANLQSGAIINEAGADLDFRIESDDNANMFFVDGGNVFATECFNSSSSSSKCEEGVSFDELRYSAGLGISWLSPVGPLSIAISKPLNAKESDETQVFQFSLGQSF